MLKNFMACMCLVACVLSSTLVLHAQQQETEESISYATQYLDIRTSSLNKYLDRTERIQRRLLKRLRRKEAKLLRELAAKDSALYRQYIRNNITYDSIAALAKDSTALARMEGNGNRLIDSLKGIQQFIGKQGSKLEGAAAIARKADLPYAGEIASLQQRLNAQQGIDQLMQKRTSVLENLAGTAGISGLQGIQKDIYYAKEKMKAWKQLADDPDAAEEKAMEYLQGTEGFQQYLNSNNNAFGGLGNNTTVEDLQRLGYQTKSQMTQMLQHKLGDNLGAVQQRMAGPVQQYTEKLKDVTDKVGEAKQALNEGKQAAQQLKQVEKPTFRKNPERGKPFWQRLEMQYNFQTGRATADGLRPAMLELGASVAFKHTPRLSYGIGLALSTGLGQNWQNIKFTYEGLTTRAYAGWKAIYGFSVQVGYERSFRPRDRAYLPGSQSNADPSSPDKADNLFTENFGGQQQAAYLGVMKRYRINNKRNGTILIGYNFLWQREDLRSPFLFRFGWGK